MIARQVWCPHPARALIAPRVLAWTGGPDRVVVADCTRCGARGVAIGPMVGHAPERRDSVTVSMPSSLPVSYSQQ